VELEALSDLLSVGHRAHEGSAEEVRRALGVDGSARVRASDSGSGAWLVDLEPEPPLGSMPARLQEDPRAQREEATTPDDGDDKSQRAVAAKDQALARQSAVIERALADPEVAWAYPAYRDPKTETVFYLIPRIIVAVEDGIDEERLRTLLPDTLRVLRPLRGKSQYLLELTSPQADDPLTAAAALVEAHAWVRWAEPDFIQEWTRSAVPNDPLFPNQWHLSNPGGSFGVLGADARLPGAWDVETGDSSVVIAVLDDGVQTHPDLPIFTNPGEIPGNSIDDDGNGFVDDTNGWDFFSNDNNPTPCGSATCSPGVGSHGTAVAGVSAAIGDNAVGVTGACQNCLILPVRIANHATGAFASSSAIADAIEYAGELADVLNNSWGGGGSSSAITSAIQNAAANGRDGLGAPVFFATGNSASGYVALTLTGFPAGTFTFTWTYQKDGSVAAGFDTAWLDTVIFPDGSVETFEGCGGLPAGWSSSGSANWFAVDDQSRADSTIGGRCSIRAGSIGNSQTSSVSVTKTLAVGGNLTYFAWVSAERTGTSGGVGPLVLDNLEGPAECFDYLELTVSGTGPYFRICGTYSNQGSPLQDGVIAYPASVSEAIAVGAANNFDTRSSYSQWHTDALDFLCHSSGGTVAITTTDIPGANGYTATDYTSSFGGTSSASPLCAGIAGLALSHAPGLTSSDVRALMQQNTRKIGPYPYVGGRHPLFGFGAVSADMVLDNIPAGNITAQVVTIPPEPNFFTPVATTFSFSGDLAGSISHGQQLNEVVLPDIHSSAQTVPAGWTLEGIECNDGDSTGTGNVASYRVSGGESVTCTFTNCKDLVHVTGVFLGVGTVVTLDACDTLLADEMEVDFNSNVTFRAGNEIILGNSMVVIGPSQLTVEAGNSIVLRNGFSVPPGVQFTARIDAP
jgi:hypothetical protein